jgi:transposase-like protein
MGTGHYGGKEVSTELIVAPKRDLILSPVMDLHTALARLETFQQFVAGYLQESRDGGQDGGDYGPIPGAGKKKVLLKSGADKLCELYGIYDEYSIESHENFETNLFFYRVKCILKSRNDDSVVGTGLGSCSTWESKYRWRESKRKCPTCGSEAIIKGKDWKNDGLPTGWLCWEKKGGCGKKFKDGDESVEKQVLGRVENPDILDTVNTVLKMAKKRAKIDAVIGVTRSSGLFTQDMEDLPQPTTPEPAVVTEAKTFTRPAVNERDAALAAQDSGGKKAPAFSGKGTPEAPNGSGHTEPTPPERQPGDDYDDEQRQPSDPDATIDQGRQTNLHIVFRKAIKNAEAREKSDVWLEQWLKNRGYIVDGRGSSTKIPMVLFEEVKKEAIAYAAGMPK